MTSEDVVKMLCITRKQSENKATKGQCSETQKKRHINKAGSEHINY